MLVSLHQYSSGCGVIQQAADNTDDPDFRLLSDPQYLSLMLVKDWNV